jgi:hypothetical protein
MPRKQGPSKKGSRKKAASKKGPGKQGFSKNGHCRYEFFNDREFRIVESNCPNDANGPYHSPVTLKNYLLQIRPSKLKDALEKLVTIMRKSRAAERFVNGIVLRPVPLIEAVPIKVRRPPMAAAGTGGTCDPNAVYFCKYSKQEGAWYNVGSNTQSGYYCPPQNFGNASGYQCAPPVKE